MPMDPERWKQIDELFGAALQVGLEERAAFLDKACVGDEDLRREVETLLASDRKEQGYIEEYPMKMAADLLATPQVKLGSGKFIGHYKILSLLGAGGMGEVYRASDPRIGREVAIKILPDHFSKDPERLRRFELEARAAGILNHPNILAIHDTGTYNGSPYLVSELLQGEVLQRKLTGQPLPIRKIIDYSLQIAKGLSAAHEKGIVHRDLKPANIFITKEGRVKILDFGLAKLTYSEASARSLASSAETLEELTETGVVLGTVVYMSPEQVSGRKVDHRSDIFAFGAVLYEMLYGKRPFRGETQIEIMHAILKGEPPELSAIHAIVPISLERIVRRCLEKDPNERFQSASDLAFALESMSTTSGTTVATYEQKKSIPVSWILSAIFFLAALIFGAAFYRSMTKGSSEIPLSVQRLSIVLPPNSVLNSSAISPDGQRLAYVTNGTTGFSKLWLRSMDSGHAEEVPGAEDATLPFWSPDSRYIGFFTEDSLKKLSIGGGVETLSEQDIDIPKGGTWNQNGDILFSPRSGTGLYRISSRGGEATPVTHLDDSRGEFRDLFPQFLPDGRHFLYIHRAYPDYRGVFIGSLDSKDRKRILTNTKPVRYIEPGYLLFVQNDKLMVQQFDKIRLELTGEAIPIANDSSGPASGPDFSVSENNILVQGISGIARTWWASQPTWFDRSGKQASPMKNYPSVVGGPGRYFFCDISSDDKRLLAVRNGAMCMFDLLEGSFVRFAISEESEAVFSPDGTEVAYANANENDLYRRPSNGTGKAELLYHLPEQYAIQNLTWSADNKYITFTAFDRKTRLDPWILPLTGERKPFPYLQTEAREALAVFSPNGKWITYESNESGQLEVYVRSFPLEAGAKWQISTDGGEEPLWRRDGKELFYLTPDKQLMACEVQATEIFKAGSSKLLFQTYVDPRVHTWGLWISKQYLASSDGKYFLVNKLVDNPVPAEITVFLNWKSMLKR